MASEYLRPEFFIIGERKCGTSSLYRYLCDHPQVLPCKVKEPQFFSRSFVYRLLNRGKYEQMFPKVGDTAPIRLQWWVLDAQDQLRQAVIEYPRAIGKREVTGEASANTFASVPPGRIKEYTPHAHVILLMRDPVERAYSHYRMFERFQAERRKLPFKVTNFFDDTRAEIEAFKAGKRTYFVGLGVYVDRLRKWQDAFEGNLHVYFTEDLADFERRSMIMKECVDFLGIDRHDFSTVLKSTHNTASRAHVPADGKALLKEFYAPYDQQLSEVLNVTLPWV